MEHAKAAGWPGNSLQSAWSEPPKFMDWIKDVPFDNDDDFPPVRGLEVDARRISAYADDLRVAMDALRGAPEVREDRVAELRRQVELGLYDVCGDELAEKLLVRSGWR